MLRHRQSSPEEQIVHESTTTRRFRGISTMFILFLVNLLNYMDRFTIAGFFFYSDSIFSRSIRKGVLDQIQDYFKIDNASGGLLQTVFICSYMTLAPIFGYLGDRYSRRLIMASGIFVWSMMTFLGSFMPSSRFTMFVVCRGLVGIGEASYSCVAPSVIADLYEGDSRSKMLAIYYLAIPFGSGLGYIVGSHIATALGGWQWALRVTPAIGILCIVLLLFLLNLNHFLRGLFFVLKQEKKCFKIHEPRRGQSEGHQVRSQASSYMDDIRSLCGNRSFIGVTLSFTGVAFVVGALSWWSPNFMKLAYEIHSNSSTTTKPTTAAPVSLIFGAITCLAGVIGVVVGSSLSRRLRPQRQNADALICGFAVLASVPFLFLALYTAKFVIPVSWILIFVGITLMCFTWSLIADIILFVVVPARRATAEAFQILVSHLLGDAGSPYLIGLISDKIEKSTTNASINVLERFTALQQSLYINAFVTVMAGAGFLITAFYISGDRRKAEVYMRGDALRSSTEEDDDDNVVGVSGGVDNHHNHPTDSYV